MACIRNYFDPLPFLPFENEKPCKVLFFSHLKLLRKGVDLARNGKNGKRPKNNKTQMARNGKGVCHFNALNINKLNPKWQKWQEWQTTFAKIFEQ